MKRFHVHRGLWTLVCLCLVLVICLFVGCAEKNPAPAESGGELDSTVETTEGTESSDGEGTNAETVFDTMSDTVPDTGSSDTEGETIENESETSPETESAPFDWAPDTGIFNEGIVDYEKLVETEIVSAYPDDKLGQLMSPGDAGVNTIFKTDFSDNDVTAGGKASPRAADAFACVDGSMYFPYSASSADYLASDGWTTWAPNDIVSLSAYKQSALYLKWDVRSKANGAWMSAMIGCYVTNVGSTIPDNPGDGLWISFQENANELVVYHPDTKSWHEGWSHIPVEAGLMNGTFEATVVCTPDRTTYVYIMPEGGTTARLIAAIRFADGKISTYDEANTMINEDTCTTNSVQGEGYSLFVHGGGAAVVDEVALMGASTGNVIEHVTVTATPTEGNALGLDITDKTDLVSICYSVWFDAILGSGTEPVTNWNNVTEVLAGNQTWGGTHAFHYWAKPAVGYYRSSDKAVIRTHMTQLYTAGVDFIVIDLTNAGDGYIGTGYWTSYIQKPMDAICDTIMEMRAEGLGTPYVVFWVGDGKGPLYRELYDQYHNVEKWKDCFVYWEGKPFLITTHTQPATEISLADFIEIVDTQSRGTESRKYIVNGTVSNIENDGQTIYIQDTDGQTLKIYRAENAAEIMAAGLQVGDAVQAIGVGASRGGVLMQNARIVQSDGTLGNGQRPVELILNELYTTRSMWGLKSEYNLGQWSFLNGDNSRHLAVDANGNPEQVSVAVAAQVTYMSQPTAHGRDGGTFWYRQWHYAFEVHPKIVNLTWWNEWTAQRFDVDGLDGPQFVDNYNQNYSRDIEPMTGGHGDQYYQWMIQYISAYKGGKECPVLVEDEYMDEALAWLAEQNG